MIDTRNFPFLALITESSVEKEAEIGITEFSGIPAYAPKYIYWHSLNDIQRGKIIAVHKFIVAT